MAGLFRAEVLKITTVPTTWILLGAAFLLLAFFSFYASGYQQIQATLTFDSVKREVLNDLVFVAFFAGIITILQMTNEFRFRTIHYAFTASRSRLRVLFAKLAATLSFTAIVAAFAALVGGVFYSWGVSAKGLNLPPQNYDLGYVALWGLLYVLIFATFGYVLALLFRSALAAIAVMFLAQGIFESLASQILKDNSYFLPFSALQQMIQGGTHTISQIELLAALSIYAVVGLSVGMILVVRRDVK